MGWAPPVSLAAVSESLSRPLTNTNAQLVSQLVTVATTEPTPEEGLRVLSIVSQLGTEEAYRQGSAKPRLWAREVLVSTLKVLLSRGLPQPLAPLLTRDFVHTLFAIQVRPSVIRLCVCVWGVCSLQCS